MPEAARRSEPVGAALALDDVSSGYGAISIVKGVTLSVGQGEIVALLGKNGMGKTTLLKTVLGMVALRGGGITIGGQALSGLSPAKLVALGVGYAPQEQPLFQDLSIRDNLRLAVPSDRMLPGALERLFGHFPFLKERLGQRAGTLSGGEQKMLILGRALMLRPRLLLIDEISEGIQPSMVERLRKVLLAERDAGLSMLVVEQHVAFALGLADRYAVLKLGEIVDSGSAKASDARERVIDHLAV
ncbi:ABC transporter ATP-binding protein [Methylobacterium persicinum]|uniref:Branched-chain amino acid transport system ATP-binding protein n=1 Tax=Methylobacterium persicinum TaxID=374426 RepID=A0ABU0HK43_9HYPH|nr:ABC transporter ATP-binding protein [Methylobacterium persicinum]MDQ0442680.1 branched-chain amino acid transport system ATP-binding protein [Methylobacterium persicinum]GJE37073.1 High-affinity branched-chain amino acid transport ATP-binding protein LivF [Methylobacterium persicinum]